MKGQEQKPSRQREAFLKDYFENNHDAAVKKLESCGMSEISPYRTDHWYIGDDADGTVRKYYSGKFKGEACFAKLAKNDSTIKNEIYVNAYVTEKGISFVPKTYYYEYDHGDGESLLITQFKAGIRDFSVPESEEAFTQVCKCFIDMCRAFAAIGVQHGDISESNLLVDSEGKLLMTDFGIGRAPGSEKFEIDYVVHDGTYYRTEGNLRTYDDVYSFLMMLDDCGLPESFKALPCYKELREMLGAFQFQVNI